MLRGLAYAHVCALFHRYTRNPTMTTTTDGKVSIITFAFGWTFEMVHVIFFALSSESVFSYLQFGIINMKIGFKVEN